MLAGGKYSTVSRIVGLFGIAPQNWLQSVPLLMIIVVNTWRGIAFAMILMTSGLSAVPTEVYEAARMDGATPRQIFWRITLPLLRPTIFLYMLVSTAGHDRDFRADLHADPRWSRRRDRNHRHLHLQPVLHRIPARLWIGGCRHHARSIRRIRSHLCSRAEGAGMSRRAQIHESRSDCLRVPDADAGLLPAAFSLGDAGLGRSERLPVPGACPKE